MLAYKGSVAEGDCVATLELLLERARRGEITGIAFAATTAREYEIHFVGSVLDEPHDSLSICCIMQAELTDRIRRQLRLVPD